MRTSAGRLAGRARESYSCVYCVVIDKPPQHDDAQLIADVLAGGPGPFTELVRRYQDALVGYLYGALGRLEEAHVLAREILREIYRELDRYNTSYPFSAWLFSLARKRARGRRAGPGGGRLHEAIQRLGADHRQLILLRHYGRMPLDEIANLVGQPPAALRQEISLARRRLAQELEG